MFMEDLRKSCSKDRLLRGWEFGPENKNEEQMESYNSGRSQGLLCLQKVNWGQESKVVSGKASEFIHIEVLTLTCTVCVSLGK